MRAAPHRRVRGIVTAAALCGACSGGAGAESLHSAASEGDLVGVLAALSRGSDVNAVNERGETALLLALGPHGSCHVAKLLVSQGADVNHSDNWGNTPLMNAAMWVSGECVRQLLEAGADVNAQAADGATAAMLVGNDGGEGTLAVLAALVDSGADPAIRANDGRTIFSSMARFERTDLMDLLVARGISE